MKNITKTITSRTITAIIFNESSETLETNTFTKCGEKFDGVDRHAYGVGYQICKIKDVSEPVTNTYIMSVDEFIKKAVQDEAYHYGFINRKIGGKVCKCLVFDLDAMKTTEIEYEHGTEKQISKLAELDNCKLLKILDTYNVNESFYYMSEETFIKSARVKESKPE